MRATASSTENERSAYVERADGVIADVTVLYNRYGTRGPWADFGVGPEITISATRTINP